MFPNEVEIQSQGYVESRVWTQARAGVHGVASPGWPGQGAALAPGDGQAGDPLLLCSPAPLTGLLPSQAGGKISKQKPCCRVWPALVRSSRGAEELCVHCSKSRRIFINLSREKEWFFFPCLEFVPTTTACEQLPRKCPAPHLCDPAPPAAIPTIQHPRTGSPGATSRYLHSYKTKCSCFLFIHTVPANIRLK